MQLIIKGLNEFWEYIIKCPLRTFHRGFRASGRLSKAPRGNSKARRINSKGSENFKKISEAVRRLSEAVQRRLHHTWTFNTLIVIGIDADLLLFSRIRILAGLQRLQFMVTLQVGPSPDSTIYNMWKSFTMRDLQSAIEWARQCHTFAWCSRIAQSPLKIFECTFLLLEFLDKWVDRLLGPFLFLIALLPTKESLNGRTCKWKEIAEVTDDWRWHGNRRTRPVQESKWPNAHGHTVWKKGWQTHKLKKLWLCSVSQCSFIFNWSLNNAKCSRKIIYFTEFHLHQWSKLGI